MQSGGNWRAIVRGQTTPRNAWAGPCGMASVGRAELPSVTAGPGCHVHTKVDGSGITVRRIASVGTKLLRGRLAVCLRLGEACSRV